MHATDPYRDEHEEPVSRYAIRSSAGFAIFLGFCGLLAATTVWFGIGRMAWSGRTPDVLMTIILTALGPLMFVAMWSSRRTYLVAGGRGTISLFRDRVEISDGDGRHLIAGASMRTEQIQHRAKVWLGFIPVTTVETDRHIRMQSPGRAFQLSRRLFADPDHFDAFCRDVDALGRGELGVTPDPVADAPRASAPPTEDDEYRRRLAYELDNVDDA